MTAKATILYIEDDRASQKLVNRVLEGQGYRVLVASEGLEGIELARREKPQLILMDLNLPSLDGREITTRLRSIAGFGNTPIVAVTASANPGSREQALAAGCSGFLTKPIDVVGFPRQIESFLSGRTEPLPDEARSRELEKYAQRLVERLENKISELETANQKLRDLDQMKSNFIVLVSHELRTPLTLISGYLFVLKESLERAKTDEVQENIGESIEGLEQGVDRLSQVIAEVIRVSRITAGRLDLAFTPTRLSHITDRICSQLAHTLRSRSLMLKVDDLSSLPLVEADGAQLEIAIGNLVNNAIKFTPDRGQVTIRGKMVGDTVDLTVSDTGVGIPQEKQRLIFEQFHVLGSIQHHSSSRSGFQGGGMGLGLPIAKGIIEAHHGRIWVESPGYHPESLPGSTFHVLLPIKQP